MRRRLLLTTVGVSLAVLLLLAWPVFVVLRDAARAEAERRQDEAAQRVTRAFQTTLDAGALPPTDVLVRYVTLGDQLVVTGPDGAVRLRLADRPEGEVLTGTATTPGGVTVAIVSPDTVVQERVNRYVVALGSLVLVGAAAAAVLSWLTARRLARPFEQLSAAAARLGDGDFSAAVPTGSGVPEIDEIGQVLAASATRLDQLLSAERSFTGDASHQLRTGLTGIVLRLEMLARHPDDRVRAEADAALEQTRQLNDTIDELLTLARHGRAVQRVPFDLGRLVQAHVDDFRPRFERAGRTVSVTGATARVLGTPGFAGQVVDVLLDNALRHGSGPVTVHLERDAVTVADEGAGVAEELVTGLFRTPADPGAQHGRGLPLARRLAEADGGTVELAHKSPATFRYRLPLDHRS